MRDIITEAEAVVIAAFERQQRADDARAYLDISAALAVIGHTVRRGDDGAWHIMPIDWQGKDESWPMS